MRSHDEFDQLLQRYRGLLYSLGRRYSRRGLEVDDLLQEASVALWRSRQHLLTLGAGPRQAALAWHIVHDAMVDALRRLRPTVELPEGYEVAAEDTSLVDELHAQVELLDEPDRTLVTLQLQGYSYDEIAARTGLTVKNVSVRLTRAREKLRKHFI